MEGEKGTQAGNFCKACQTHLEQIAKLKKINQALINRVERSTDMQEDAFTLFQTATSLEVKVAERTAALNEALRDLESSNNELQIAKTAAEEAYSEMRKALEREKELSELKTRFVSMASHEFRTPLATISSSAELLGRFQATWDESKKEKHLNRIQTNVEHMAGLLEDVLVLGQVEAGKLEVHRESLNLASFISELIEDARYSIGARHEIKVSVPPACINVEADKKILRVLLTNLLSNAFKYSPEGSPVTVNAKATETELRFEVSDQGIGIPEEDIAHLFQPFHRAGNVETTQGTGLGLAILKKAIDIHGGTVEVESTVGRGSTFTVQVPLNGIITNC